MDRFERSESCSGNSPVFRRADLGSFRQELRPPNWIRKSEGSDVTLTAHGGIEFGRVTRIETRKGPVFDGSWFQGYKKEGDPRLSPGDAEEIFDLATCQMTSWLVNELDNFVKHDLKQFLIELGPDEWTTKTFPGRIVAESSVAIEDGSDTYSVGLKLVLGGLFGSAKVNVSMDRRGFSVQKELLGRRACELIRIANHALHFPI